MSLQVTDPAQANIQITLASPSKDFSGTNFQFKHHPQVAKFMSGQPRVVALKDPSSAFPVGQSLSVLKWRYSGRDESKVPFSSEFSCKIHPQKELDVIFLVHCWPSSDGDGLFNMSIEYKLQNENVTLYDVVISMPFPCVSGHIFILYLF